MKIRIDMQGVQTASRHRGIGRYCLSVTREFVELASPGHQTRLLFNAALDGIDEAMTRLRASGTHVPHGVFGPIRQTGMANPANQGRRLAAERVFTHALEAGAPDVVWLSSVVEGFGDDALVPDRTPGSFTVATLYDLIPLHDPAYLGQAGACDWYNGRLEVLKRCDLLLAISEWAREDAIKRLDLDPARIVAIGAGVESHFKPAQPGSDSAEVLRVTYGIEHPFVMYNGGFDKRKNVFALLEAFASLPMQLRCAHQLVLVGRMDDQLAGRFTQAIDQLGLSSDNVVFAGFVSDEDLVRLYQSCRLFVFPSECEGFGLPPLEAMACGAAVIVNDVTSLPEVVGDPDAMFDASKPGAMAAKIHDMLTQPGQLERLRRNGPARAVHFSWRAVAGRALSAIETHVSRGHTGRSPPFVPHPMEFIVSASQARTEAPATEYPLYRVEASNAAAMLPWIRQWPGPVFWCGPLPVEGPSNPADRYRLGGYGRILGKGTGSDWIGLIESEGVPVSRVDEANPLIDDLLALAAESICPPPAIVRQRRLEDSIARDLASRLGDDDLARVADAIDRLRTSTGVRWLVDVTNISKKDLGTGIQRVVRSILREWLACPPPGVRIEPIAFRNGRYHHAHAYACTLLGIHTENHLPGNIVSASAGDVFVGLDWAMESLPTSSPLLEMWRRAGVAIHFVVNDLLPVTLPDAFHPYIRERFLAWLLAITTVADALHCISNGTAEELREWLAKHGPVNQFGVPPVITSFRLGVDMHRPAGSTRLSPALESAMNARPSLLMVGTLEPRKGHRQALDALEILWANGSELNLVIVGHRGWLVKDILERLSGHKQIGKQLFWLDDADDATLEAVYTAATVLLAPSLGEGFGLPLVEAANRGLPVIARSLPVFHEVVGDYPSYFDSETAEGLATHISQWLEERPSPGKHGPWTSWEESAHALEQAIQGLGAKKARTL